MAYYQGGYYQPQPQQYYQPQPQTQAQIVNGGFISVPSETAARNYPIAHGTSLTFKDENAPYVYTKTMGFSQMDVPVFEKYRLIRETDLSQKSSLASDATTNRGENPKDEIEALQTQIESIRKDVDMLLDFKAEFGGGDDE